MTKIKANFTKSNIFCLNTVKKKRPMVRIHINVSSNLITSFCLYVSTAIIVRNNITSELIVQ